MIWPTGPCSTISPARITATRSHSSATTARSWLMNRTDMPSRRRSSRSSSSTSACTVTSSALVGSSASSTSARSATASAMATRCSWPPDSCDGYRRSRSGESSTSRMACGRAVGRLAPGQPVLPQRPQRDVADPEHRVERHRRALEDRRDPAPAHIPQLAVGQAGQLPAVQLDAAGDGGADRAGQAEHRQRGHRLAGTALAGQPHDLGVAQGQLVHGHHRPGAEAHGQPGDLEARRRHLVLAVTGGKSVSGRAGRAARRRAG